MPAAFVFARYRFPGKTLLSALTTIPFVLPAMVVASAFTTLLGPRGWLNTLLMDWFDMARAPIRLQQTIWLVLWPTLSTIQPSSYASSEGSGRTWTPGCPRPHRVLGGSRPRVFLDITLPLLLPAVAAAGLLIFLFCFTSFGIVLILGGPRFATLEVEIYRQAVAMFRLPEAAAIALAQIVLTFVVMAIYTRAQARASRPLNLQPAAATEIPPTTPASKIFVALTVAGLLAFLVAPLLALALHTLAPGDPLRYFRELFVNRTNSLFYVPPGVAIRNSVVFALITTALALTIGTLTAVLMSRARATAAQRCWSRSSCSPGHISGHPGLRLPVDHGAAAPQPPRLACAGAYCAHVDRVSLRRSHLAAGHPRDQPRLARGGGPARCVAVAHVARGGSAHRGPRADGRGLVRVHSQHGRIRRDATDRTSPSSRPCRW